MTLDLKNQIIIVATDLFMKQGYTATSTRQIATILQVSQPAIYHHFKNKEEIYTSVLTRFAIDVGSRLQLILKEPKSKRDVLVTMSHFLKDHHPMNLSLMMHDLKNSLSTETEKEIFIIWKEYYFSPFIEYFESIKSSIVPNLSTLVVSQHFLRILSSYISETYSNNTSSLILIDDMVDIFLRGVTNNELE